MNLAAWNSIAISSSSRRTSLIFLAASLILSGCLNSRETEVSAVLAQEDLTPDYPQPDTTYLSFSPKQGFQVEYLAADGRSYLWYPGNRTGVRGRWTKLLDEMCFYYGSDADMTARKWQCRYRAHFSKANLGWSSGDLFNLRSGSVPHVLARCHPPKGIEVKRKYKCWQ
ncbi:hypothetical protein ETW24_17425 [Leisingera sp. NJS204]|nr:hypothetical protein ETW24_17425 [Leisingera sp. NJS204]